MTTTFDSHQNLAYSAVATAPSPPTSGTSLTLTASSGALFPTTPFNAVVWPGGGATASQSNAEIVRVTAISTDTLTIIRAQEGSTAQSIGVGYQVALTATAKVFTDIEAAINASLGGALSGTLPNPTIAAGAVGASQLAAGAATGAALGSDVVTTSTGLVQLSRQVLGSADNVVNFPPTGSLLQTFSALRLVVVGRGDAAASTVTVSLRFNGDAGNNYDYEQTTQQGSTLAGAEALAQSSLVVGALAAASAPAGAGGSIIVDIPAYSLTDFWKTVSAENAVRWGTGTGSAEAIEIDGDWRSTAAITSIAIIAGSGNFVAGSYFELWGLA